MIEYTEQQLLIYAQKSSDEDRYSTIDNYRKQTE